MFYSKLQLNVTDLLLFKVQINDIFQYSKYLSMSEYTPVIKFY